MTRLDDAIRSLREDIGGASPDAEKTLTQILGARQARRSAPRVRFLALLAATLVLVGASAWAALATRRGKAYSGRGSEVSVSAPPSLSAAPPTDTLPVPIPAPSATEVPSSAVPSESARPEPLARVPTTRPPPQTATEPRRLEELSAYEKAHRAHFDERNAASALVLWDDYLRNFPATRWEPEVRYNRALCLIRLKRIQEARHALDPFARGDYGGYRNREASDLLAALVDAGE